MCTDAPDMTAANEAAKANAEISKEALEWYKGEAARTQGMRDEISKAQLGVQNAQIATMGQQSQIATEIRDRQKAVFDPLENRLVSDAESYDSAERQAAAASTAVADVRAATAGQVSAATRSLARMGYDPTVNATRQAATTALAEAGAATQARRTTEATGRAMRVDAANLGRNLSSAQATAIQTGVGAGTAGVNAGSTALGTANSGAALMQSGFSTAISGNNSAGQIYTSAANAGGGDSGAAGAIGSVAGTALAVF